MSNFHLNRRADTMLNAIESTTGTCEHLPPVVLQFEIDGTLRREPTRCQLCAARRRVSSLFLPADENTELTAPDWLVPTIESAFADGRKCYRGIDLDEL